jgi:excisionase family DNA binding protein
LPPGSGGLGATEQSGVPESDGIHGAQGAPNTARAVAATPTLADLGVLYGGRDRLLCVPEVAEYLGVSAATVYRLCASGALPHIRVVESIRVRRQTSRCSLSSNSRTRRC